MSKILVYAGANYGHSLMKIYKNFDFCYVFEANPEIVRHLRNKFKNASNVEIIEAALSDEHNKKVNFYISHNALQGNRQNFASSSLGEISDYYRNTGPKNPITTLKTITVNTINLRSFLQERNINNIDTYVSDLEGMDYTVLQTIKYYIDNKLIKNMQIETEIDDRGGQAHVGLPPNSQQKIIKFLSKNYDVVGYQKGDYDKNSESRWIHQDVYFKLKD